MKSPSLSLRRAMWLLAGLTSINLGFLFLYRLARTKRFEGVLSQEMTNLDFEWAPPEIFQHCNEVAIVTLAAMLYIRFRQAAYAVVASLMLVLLIDDLAKVHMRVGSMVAHALDFQPAAGLRAQDLGELTIVLTYLVVFVPLLAWAHWRAQRPQRRFLWCVYALLAALGTCGVGLDMLHIVFEESPLDPFFSWSMIEEGSEMITMSCICAFMYYYWHSRTHATRSYTENASAKRQREPLEAVSSE